MTGHRETQSSSPKSANGGSRGGLIDYDRLRGHVLTLDGAKAAAVTLVLILMKCIATHVDFGPSRPFTPANLPVLQQRYIPT